MTSIAETLRREFDAAFALPALEPAGDGEALLAIRVGERPYALRTRELIGMAVGQRLTPVPSAHPALVGLAGIRGTIVPVFELAILLGGTRPREGARWVAVSAGPEPLGFAFGELEGHLRLVRSDLGPNGGAEKQWASEIVLGGTVLRPVLDVMTLVASVRLAAALERQGKGG